ncbi:MAG: sulfite exporter TauE/SafE family protein [Deltaproteobacteria bacterium]|nr:sulfite exporter TauE/SafE family protein [Deltaproteobacteria bacterium]
MAFLLWHFPVSGVTTSLLLPPLVSFVISFFTSMGGVSGAFLLLPFQVSFLGYTAPSVSATNQVFNIIAIPSGVWRYIKEGRMVWPLTWAVIIGTLPGVFVGAWVRIRYLPDPTNFKFFAGFVLLYIGLRLLLDMLHSRTDRPGSGGAGDFVAGETSFSLRRVRFTFNGTVYSFPVPGVLAFTFIVGIVGGIYGIGGGVIIAPFFITFLKLPVYIVAGACLMGTLITSIAGVGFYHLLALLHPEMSIAPDWSLGVLFGAGGFAGIYLGARVQKYVPVVVIKLILTLSLLFVALRYLAGIFR